MTRLEVAPAVFEPSLNGAPVRQLVLVLGDQLSRDATAFDAFDPACDLVWMAEASEESTHVWSTQQRIAVFLSAMRHFAQGLRDDGLPLEYQTMPAQAGTLGDALRLTLARRPVERIVCTHPGDWRVLQDLRSAAGDTPLDVREDRHFLCTRSRFEAHAKGRKQLRMEYFYREMRRHHRVLMDGAQPLGGKWNFDTDNRMAFGAQGPGFVPPPLRFAPDETTRAVVDLVQSRFGDHPGRLASFGWAVTRIQALQVLDDFVAHRLPAFGHWQDAMWSGEPWLYHSQLASAMNLKLLDPREVIARAEAAHHAGAAPLAAVEGFIRQILGWREYVRGVYWLEMPDYALRNALDAHEDLPAWYWTAATDMRCLADALTQTLEHGYAHHIQRLMVTGLFALLLGVEPKQVHGWYLSVYVDAVEWVEMPNTLGMSQYADGGLMASKPYAASGRYIDRMSDHCRGCRYDPASRTGEAACPFTTLYWDFLFRHGDRLRANARMVLQLKNAAAIGGAERLRIAERAVLIRRGEVGAACAHAMPTAQPSPPS